MAPFKKLLLILFVSSIFIGANAQTIVSEDIATNQTWTASGSPYILTKNITITAGNTLKIMPGTKIRKKGNFWITVAGGLEANGKKDSLILIDTVGFEFPANSIGYNFTTKKGSAFNYCFFKGYPPVSGGGLNTIYTETNLLISNCHFYGYNCCIRMIAGKVRMEKCVIEKGRGNSTILLPFGPTTEFEMDECIVTSTPQGGMYLASNNLITNCLFYDFGGYSGISVYSTQKTHIKCNTFRKIYRSVFTFDIGGDYLNSEFIFENNTFDSSQYHFNFQFDYLPKNKGQGKWVVKNNNFLQYSKYSIYSDRNTSSGKFDSLNFKENYWGTTDPVKIAKGIWDRKDTTIKPVLVDFSNYLGSKIMDCNPKKTYKETNQKKTICKGDSIFVGLNIYKNEGNYTDTFKKSSGPDSIVLTQLKVVSPSYNSISFTFCPGDSCKVGNQVYKIPGKYTQVFNNYIGCDSFLTINVKFNPISISRKTFFICHGDSVYINNHLYTNIGQYNDTFTNYQGCDSIVINSVEYYKEYDKCGNSVYYIPNVFSPNQNTINEFFSVVGGNFKEIRMQIFSRWGEKIFDETAQNIKWDGTYQNKPCQDGAYLYLLYMTSQTGRHHFAKGTVTVLR